MQNRWLVACHNDLLFIRSKAFRAHPQRSGTLRHIVDAKLAVRIRLGSLCLRAVPDADRRVLWLPNGHHPDCAGGPIESGDSGQRITGPRHKTHNSNAWSSPSLSSFLGFFGAGSKVRPKEGDVQIELHRAAWNETSPDPSVGGKSWALAPQSAWQASPSRQPIDSCEPKPGTARNTPARTNRARWGPHVTDARYARGISGSSTLCSRCSSRVQRQRLAPALGSEPAVRKKIPPAQSQTSGLSARALRSVYARTAQNLPSYALSSGKKSLQPKDSKALRRYPN